MSFFTNIDDTGKLYSFLKEEKTEVQPTAVATEMIARQEEDYIIPLLNNYFTNIVSTIKKYELEDDEIYKNRVVYQNLKSIDALLKERFGINFTHSYLEGVGYACLPVPPKAYNILNRDIRKNYKILVSELGKLEKTDPALYRNADNADLLTENDDELRYVGVYKKFKQSFDKIEETMNTKGIVIDRERAKVIGLPGDYEIILGIDISDFVWDYSIQPQELTAILLHEVGHAFTHLEYSYRAIATTSVMTDTILENISTKNRSPKEAIKIAYERATGEKINSKDLEGINPISTVIYLTEKFTRYITGHNVHSYTDSEQLADQFAVRFGQGNYLASALAKFGKDVEMVFGAGGIHSVNVGGNSVAMLPMVGTIIFVDLLILLILICIALPLGFLFVLLAPIILFAAISVIFAIIYRVLFSGQSAVERETYDENRRRLERIRNDMIRQLRTSKLPKKTIDNLVSLIENVNEIVKETPQKALPFLERLYIKFSASGNKALEVRTIERLSEDLMENGIYLAASKMRSYAENL